MPSPSPNATTGPTSMRDLTGALIRRRKAAVALLLTLSIGVAALALISFAKLLPVRGDAAHSVESLEKVRQLDGALTRATEATVNRDRTPKEAIAVWNAVAPAARAVAEIGADDDDEDRAIRDFTDGLATALGSIGDGVSDLERSDPLLAGSARSKASIGLGRVQAAARKIEDLYARQLDQQMGAARLWLAICLGLVLLTGLMMAVTVLTWVYANHADRARARKLNPAFAADEEAAEAAGRLSLLIDRGPLAVTEWNADGVCTRWSVRAEEMFGRKAADVIGKRWDDLPSHIHVEDAARVAAEIAPLLRGETDQVVIRHRNVRPDGTVIYCIWYNSTIRDGNGTPNKFLSLATDITREVVAEEALRNESELVRRIAAAAPLGITVSAPDGTVLFANDFIVELLGVTREDHATAHIDVADWKLEELDGTPIPEEQRPSSIALTTGNTVRARELRVRSKYKPEPTCLSTTAVPLRDKNGNVDGVLLIHEDITERISADAEREALATELSHARRLETVGNLAGGIAHDFGNALLAISYSADTLAAAAAEGHSTAEQAAQLNDAIAVARELTSSLVNYAAGRDGTRRPLDLAAFVTSHCKFVGRLLPAQFKVVCLPAAAPGPVLVNASVSQLLQVLMNLAVNARDAMPDGGTVTLGVAVDTSGPAPLAVLEVTDTGHGISAEVSKRAFERFFTTKEPGHGSGIGLSTVRHIVKDHGGSVEIATAPGQGTRFTVRLPMVNAGNSAASPSSASPGGENAQAAALSDAARAASVARAPASAATPQPKVPRAMVVESDDRVRPLIVQTLRNSGYQVESFTSTSAALEAFSPAPTSWAVVLMELDTGGLDGATCLRRMRKAVPGLPALLITADAADASGHFVDEYTRVLLKPFTVGSLRSALNDLFSHPTPR